MDTQHKQKIQQAIDYYFETTVHGDITIYGGSIIQMSAMVIWRSISRRLVSNLIPDRSGPYAKSGNILRELPDLM